MNRDTSWRRNLNDAPSQAQVERHLQALAPYWHPVARSSSLDERNPLGVKLLGRELVLARLDGKLAALDGYCRHFQARLALGEVCTRNGKELLCCPYHGWSYGSDGQCRYIPQLPESKAVPSAARVASYPVAQAHGLIWVCLGGTPAHDVPAFPEAGDPAFHTVTLDEPAPTEASAMRMILATLDDTHFPWVHEGILGARDRPAPPDHSVWREGSTLRCAYCTAQPANQTSADASTGTNQAEVTLSYDNTVYMPSTLRLVKDSPAGRYVIWLACCPVDAFATVNFWSFARNYDLAASKDSDYAAFSQQVRDQDKPIIESQRPRLVPPLSTHISLAMSPADAPLLEYLRWLDELGITVTS